MPSDEDRTGLYPDGFCSDPDCENALSSDEEIENGICDDCAQAYDQEEY